MDTPGTRIHERLGALADETRTRLLLLLAQHELSVNELCAALRLPQSTVSRHLKVLADDGWVMTRADGPSRYYRMARLEGAPRRLWQVVQPEVASRPEAVQDEVRAEQILQQRKARAQEFFSTAAGQWEGLRAELFGPGAGLRGLLALLQPTLVVGDLGCGTGLIAAELAHYVGRVVAVDESKAMLAAARRRLAGVANVELRTGELEALPIADAELDAAVLTLVLHYVPDPQRALLEARRAVRVGGRVLVIDMMAHGFVELREQMGHLWQGFTEQQMRGWLTEAGLSGVRWQPLVAATEAKGPMLFVCSGEVA